MSLSWRKPPPVVAIGGTEDFLRDREVKNAISQTWKVKRPVIQATSEAEVVDTLTSASAFGDTCLITVDIGKVDAELVKDCIDNPIAGCCLLLIVPGDLDEKKWPALTHVHGGYRVKHMRPATRSGQKKLAVRFAEAEAKKLLGNKDALSGPLAEALVKAIGSDLGVVSFEISKMAALARSEGSDTISKHTVQRLLRPANEVDLSDVVGALRERNQKKLSKALDKTRRLAPSDPVMLLLRAPTGPAMQANLWLKATLLSGKIPKAELASRLGIPEWQLANSVLPALKKWKRKDLRDLVGRLARVDRGVFTGAPSPWEALESALLQACSPSR